MVNMLQKVCWMSILTAVIIIAVIALCLKGCNKITDKGFGTSVSSNRAKGAAFSYILGNESDAEGQDWFGRWKVRKVLAYGESGTYSRDDAEKLINTILKFFNDEAEVFNDQPPDLPIVIKDPSYQKTIFSEDEFIVDFHMSFEKLGIVTDFITEITVGSINTTGGCALLIKDSNTIILVAGGTYFELVRLE